MTRLIAVCACIVAVSAGHAEAQTPGYLVAGITVELPRRTATTSTGSETIAIKGLSLGVGFPQTKVASLEFSGVWHTWETDIEREGEILLIEERIRNRDLPFVATVRFTTRCPDRWCAEVVGGGGINFSRRLTQKIGDCGTVLQPSIPCTPAHAPETVRGKEEPTVVFGADLKVRLFDRLDLGPTFRLWYIWRYRDKTTSRAAQIDLRRTPSNERLEVGVTATVYLR